MVKKISIITVVFNGVDILEKTILSVLSQKHNNIEFIIIDGGSDDGTVEIIKRYEEKLAYWISEKDYGIYDAMNKAIEIATGDGLLFLNAGDCLVGSVLADKMTIPSYLQVKTCSKRGVHYKIKLKSEKLGISNCHQGIIFENKKIKYNLDYKIAGDYDYFLQHGYTQHNPKLFATEGYIFYDNNGFSKVNYKLRDKEIADIILKNFGFRNYMRFSTVAKIKQLIKLILWRK